MKRIPEQRVLAIDPAPRGFGYAVMEGPAALLDWGVTGTRARTTPLLLRQVTNLIDAYEPDVIVVEAYGPSGARQRRRAHTFLRRVATLAARKNIRCRPFSRARVHEAFADVRARNKDHIALALASRFSALTVWLPRARGRWRAEAYRMAIFDAAALAITYFESRKAKPRAAESGRAPAITRQYEIPSWLKKNEHPTTSPRP